MMAVNSNAAKFKGSQDFEVVGTFESSHRSLSLPASKVSNTRNNFPSMKQGQQVESNRTHMNYTNHCTYIGKVRKRQPL
ncbi:hypothetical protein EON63_22915 [archaeon]|nr:MAG: hypothetical protein EON63_22915 [archaeon]